MTIAAVPAKRMRNRREQRICWRKSPGERQGTQREMLDERLRAQREDPGLEDVSGRLGPGGLDPLVITPPEDEFRLLSAERPVLARGDQGL
ncbi:MAG: hypothetical protein SPG17_07800 [Schaalia hyovaginalis]|nr:hypothetical protein [Schaalia hyovaginalis]